MALSTNDLKRGMDIMVDGEPYSVISVKHLHMGRGGSVSQTKVKNLKTGKIFEKTFRQSDSFEEAEIERVNAEFIYSKQNEYWFHKSGKPAERFMLASDVIGEQAVFLKPGMEVVAYTLSQKGKEEILNINLPIKAEYKVVDAPPAVRGNTAQGGTKTVTIEGGAKVSVPLFIENGDTIRINTETGEYSERA